jgi:hypothetical protein
MQIFLDGLASQCKKYDLNAELLLVEWNPPADRPPLYAALRWPESPAPLRIRIIEVPARIHNRYKYSSGLPLFQMIAKNAGIVRARSDFVLSTNIDIIFSNGLIKYLSSEDLKQGCFYRVDRHDVSRDVYKYRDFEELLAACDRHIIRINHRNGITGYSGNESTEFYPTAPAIPFMGKRRKYIPGWKFILSNPDHRYVRLVYKLLRQYRNWLRLHTNACGDFTLMSKEDWFLIRGSPELEMYSLHLDSIVCYSAHFAGVQEIILDYPVYHIEHDSGWTPEAEKDRSLYRNLESRKVPVMSIKELDRWIARMHRRNGPLNHNGDDWGLAQEQLKETVIS